MFTVTVTDHSKSKRGRVEHTVETATPMVKFFDYLAKDENAGKITSAQAIVAAKIVAGARRSRYSGGVNVTLGKRTYKITGSD